MTPDIDPHPHRRGRRAHSVLALALLAGLTVASCGTPQAPSAGSQAGQHNEAQAQGQGQAQASVGRRTVTTVDGSQITVPARDEVTVAYFFSPGCASCIPAMKDLAAAQRQTPQARYVAINLFPDTPASTLRHFLASAGDPEAALVKNGQRLAEAHQVSALGTTIVYTPDGREVFRGVDASTSAITKAVQEARQ